MTLAIENEEAEKNTYVKKSKKPRAEFNRYVLTNKIAALTHPHFDGGKYKKGMTITEACERVGIDIRVFQQWRQNDIEIKNLWEGIHKTQLEVMKQKAMKNVESALYGETKLRPADMVNVSLRFLEKVADDFRDKTKLEITVEGNDFSTSLDDLKKKALELAGILWEVTEEEKEHNSPVDDE